MQIYIEYRKNGSFQLLSTEQAPLAGRKNMIFSPVPRQQKNPTSIFLLFWKNVNQLKMNTERK